MYHERVKGIRGVSVREMKDEMSHPLLLALPIDNEERVLALLASVPVLGAVPVEEEADRPNRRRRSPTCQMTSLSS